jgi:hypothetical protein
LVGKKTSRSNRDTAQFAFPALECNTKFPLDERTDENKPYRNVSEAEKILTIEIHQPLQDWKKVWRPHERVAERAPGDFFQPLAIRRA